MPILILPEYNIYESRWKNRNPNLKRRDNFLGRYKRCERISKENDGKIIVIDQPVDESVDVTIYRICEQVLIRLIEEF